MPCDSIILNTVDMPKMHPDLLTRALKQLGARDVQTVGSTVYFTLDGARLTLQGGQLRSSYVSQSELGQYADRLKNAYSHQVVQSTAARNGWTLKQVGANNYVVQKR